MCPIDGGEAPCDRDYQAPASPGWLLPICLPGVVAALWMVLIG